MIVLLQEQEIEKIEAAINHRCLNWYFTNEFSFYEFKKKDFQKYIVLTIKSDGIVVVTKDEQELYSVNIIFLMDNLEQINKIVNR